jgi:hypothetical protein
MTRHRTLPTPQLLVSPAWEAWRVNPDAQEIGVWKKPPEAGLHHLA